MKEYNEKIDRFNGVVFDGIPRNEHQAEFLKSKFSWNNSVFVNIFLEEDVLLEKLMGRRVCLNCGHNYNVCEIHRNGYEMEPLLPKGDKNKCDECGDDLVKRDDDEDDIIKERIKTYK